MSLNPDIRKKLQAMYELSYEYKTRYPGGSLPFNLDDLLHQTKHFLELEDSPEHQAEVLGVPLSFVLALRDAVRNSTSETGEQNP